MLPAAPRRTLRSCLAAAVLLAGIAGCGGSDESSGAPAASAPPTAPAPTAAPTAGGAASSGPPTSSGPATSSGQATTPLGIELLDPLTTARFTSDPNCPHGEWDENSTGVEEEFRASSTFFRQYDCYRSEADVGGVPFRLQQALYAEFSDAASARAYADDRSALYPTLVDGNKVLVADTGGLDTVDDVAYLTEVKNACGCGTIMGS